jgi:hypothetical protein
MTAFGEYCHSRLIASLHSQSIAAARSTSGLHRQGTRRSELAAADTTAAFALCDVQCLSALLLSRRAAASIGSVLSTSAGSITADDLIPASVRTVCDAFIAFAPQAKFGAGATSAQVQKGYKSPVHRFSCLAFVPFLLRMLALEEILFKFYTPRPRLSSICAQPRILTWTYEHGSAIVAVRTASGSCFDAAVSTAQMLILVVMDRLSSRPSTADATTAGSFSASTAASTSASLSSKQRSVDALELRSALAGRLAPSTITSALLSLTAEKHPLLCEIMQSSGDLAYVESFLLH